MEAEEREKEGASWCLAAHQPYLAGVGAGGFFLVGRIS